MTGLILASASSARQKLLRQAGIAFEVVPGVTAALAAGAFAGIPLTQRSHASAVALVTGHEDPAKPEGGVDGYREPTIIGRAVRIGGRKEGRR